MTPPTPTTCVCGQPVHLARNGKTLNAGPQHIGPYDPTTGQYMTVAQVLHNRAGGTTLHNCPGPLDVQEVLFG